MSAKTCGPAFPYVHDVQPQPGMVRSIVVEQGMTTRDYFAAHAPEMPKWFSDAQYYIRVDERLAQLAKWRWAYADAMITGRGE